MRHNLIGVLLLAIVACEPTQARAAKVQEHERKPNYRALVLNAPRPDYPYEARRGRITGSGVAILQIDKSTGKVVSCRMDPSTGSTVLDAGAMEAFRQWRFKPGTVAMARIPITFAVGGQVLTEYRVKEKPMDEALAAFLGKGTVEKGPIPAYPRSVPWTNKQGKAVFELHAQKDGRVSEVRILKASGDAVFDRIAVDTLRKWRLRRGPLILELPLSFKLTPASYEVDIPKNR
jgi:TonB family protein